MRLTARMSFAQKAAKESMDLVTCSASSRVGTRMRAEVQGVEDVCNLLELLFLLSKF